MQYVCNNLRLTFQFVFKSILNRMSRNKSLMICVVVSKTCFTSENYICCVYTRPFLSENIFGYQVMKNIDVFKRF